MSKRASDYRTRAAELRAIAEDMKGRNERELLLEVAKEYELMAQSADTEVSERGDGPDPQRGTDLHQKQTGPR